MSREDHNFSHEHEKDLDQTQGYYREDDFHRSSDDSYETNTDPEHESESGKKRKERPWARHFGSDESPKNRQYSRSSRNKPAKEATTLSNVLLGIAILLLIIPFGIYMVIDAQRSNDDIARRTTEELSIVRNASSEDETESESEPNSESVSEDQSDDESESRSRIEVSSRPVAESSTPSAESAPPAETTPPVETPTEPSPSGGTYHTVEAGQTWYGIARIYGINVYDLMAANGANENTILHPGDSVLVP